MKLTVLGKYGPYPPFDGACSGYLVEQEDLKILLDCGSGVLSRLYKYTRPENLNGIFISHLHFDHISDLLPMRYALEIAKASINLFIAYEDSSLYHMIEKMPEFNIINIDEDTKIKINGVELLFYPMKHSVTDYAVRITGEKTLVYTGDTMYCDKLFEAAHGADLLLADCSQKEGSKSPHMTVLNAVDIKNKTNIRLVATHINPNYDPTEYFKSKGGIETSEEFKVYHI